LSLTRPRHPSARQPPSPQTSAPARSPMLPDTLSRSATTFPSARLAPLALLLPEMSWDEGRRDLSRSAELRCAPRCGGPQRAGHCGLRAQVERTGAGKVRCSVRSGFRRGGVSVRRTTAVGPGPAMTCEVMRQAVTKTPRSALDTYS
jgi:hypothetical protein